MIHPELMRYLQSKSKFPIKGPVEEVGNSSRQGYAWDDPNAPVPGPVRFSPTTQPAQPQQLTRGMDDIAAPPFWPRNTPKMPPPQQEQPPQMPYADMMPSEPPADQRGYWDRLFADPNRTALLRFGLGALSGEGLGRAMDAGMRMRPQPPKPYTLNPGQTRFGSNNQPIANLPPIQRPSGGGTAQMKNYQYSLQNPGFAEFLKKTGAPSGSKAVQAYEYYKSLKTPKEKQDFLATMGRIRTVDTGPSHALVSPVGQQGLPPAIPKGLPPEKQPNYLEDAAQSKEEGKFRGAQASKLPETLTKYENMIGLIDKAISHPGREGVTGMPNILTLGGLIPGTKEADYRQLAEQLKGGVFTEAFQALKGGGHITDIEGAQASQSLARLGEAQSDEAYAEALMELQHYLRLGIERAKRKAGVVSSQPTSPANIPEGIDPSVWDAMTPAERGLFK